MLLRNPAKTVAKFFANGSNCAGSSITPYPCTKKWRNARYSSRRAQMLAERSPCSRARSSKSRCELGESPGGSIPFARQAFFKTFSAPVYALKINPAIAIHSGLSNVGRFIVSSRRANVCSTSSNSAAILSLGSDINSHRVFRNQLGYRVVLVKVHNVNGH